MAGLSLAAGSANYLRLGLAERFGNVLLPTPKCLECKVHRFENSNGIELYFPAPMTGLYPKAVV